MCKGVKGELHRRLRSRAPSNPFTHKTRGGGRRSGTHKQGVPRPVSESPNAVQNPVGGIAPPTVEHAATGAEERKRYLAQLSGIEGRLTNVENKIKP